MIHEKSWGKTQTGENVTLYTLENRNGCQVDILNFGCVIQSIRVPDREGKMRDVVMGYDNIASYEESDCFYGSLVGRHANRIDDATFILDGDKYKLDPNFRGTHLHGVWHLKIHEAMIAGDELVLHRISPDGEDGFPGNVDYRVSYRLTDGNALVIKFSAATDKATVLNLTNHSYFNLNGQDGSLVLDHELKINADYFTEIDAIGCSTGKILPVKDTPFDFNEYKTIGYDISSSFPQLQMLGGYDHNMVLNGNPGLLRYAATARSRKSGIVLDVFTTQPGCQFYSATNAGEHPDVKEKNGSYTPKFGAFCLECQHYPSSLNHENFPSVILRPGQLYNEEIIFQFSVYQAEGQTKGGKNHEKYVDSGKWANGN